METSSSDLARLATLRQEIVRRAEDCGRDPATITLIAVSKTVPADRIWPLISHAQQTVFGENRVQEAKSKWEDLRTRAAVTLHLIGPLQTNKVRDAVELFDVIETVDRDNLAEALAQEKARRGHVPRLLVQVNTGAEPQKAGVLPQEADAFLQRCRDVYGLHIEGLMCIPPVGDLASPHFAWLWQFAARHGLKTLSMGMSGDWQQAVQLGATHIRIGSSIFGAR